MKTARNSLIAAAIAAVVQLVSGQALAKDAATQEIAPEHSSLSHAVAACNLVVLNNSSQVAQGGDYGV